MGSTYCGCLGYADDLVLLTPTRGSLQTLLNKCSNFAEERSILFNATKSKLIHVHPSNTREPIPPPVKLMGNPVSGVASGTHLGLSIGNCSLDITMDAVIRDFNRRVGMLRSHFKWLAPDAKYALFKTFCMPLFGCVLWDFSHASVQCFIVAWRKAIGALLGLPQRTHSALLHAVVSDDDPETQLLKRCVAFVKSLARSENQVIRACLSNVVAGSRSSMGHTLSLLCERGRCARETLVEGDHDPLLNARSALDTAEAEGGLIHDLLMIKHQHRFDPMYSMLPNVEIEFAINDICLN